MSGRKKLFYGWRVVAGGFIIMAVLHSMLQTCFSLFVVTVTQDMGISRSAFGVCSGIVSLATMLVSPYMGRWLAKKNTRVIFSICVFGTSISYASYALAQSVFHLYISAALVGVFSCGAISMPISIIITNWFSRSRGIATSIALAGSGIGGAIISPILTKIILISGWRAAFVIFGVVMMVLEVPIAYFIMKPNPQDMGMLPYGEGEYKEKARSNKQTKPKIDIDVSLKELKKCGFFWIYLVGLFSMSIVGYGTVSQLAPALTDKYGAPFSAIVISFFLMFLSPAKILLGWMYDKLGTKFGTVYSMSFFAIAMILILTMNNPILVWVMAICFSIGGASGTVLPSVMTSALFGTKNYGEIFGFANFFCMGGGVIATPVIAAVFDISGSYDAAWIVCFILCIISIVCFWYSETKCKKAFAHRITYIEEN